MSRKKSKVMIVDDELGVRESLKMLLEDDYEVHIFADPLEAFDSMESVSPSLVLLDITMPGMNGVEFLKNLREAGKDVPVVMLTATKTIKMAVQCMKYGAYDYITKPYSIEEILDVTTNAIKDYKVKLSHYVSPRNDFENFYAKEYPPKAIGKDTTLKNVFQLIKKIANTDSTILITGESGTGKEVIAKAIHNESNRSKKPFLAVHLSATPEKLIESELFGHVKGSFTGADRDHAGFMEAATGGTLFLDEIGDIPLSVQAKLLRAVQEKEYRKVGSNSTFKVNVRFISATNKDLSKEIAQKRFREDLFYRLNVIPIVLPPLRDRKCDIPELVQHFSEIICDKLQIEFMPFESEVLNAFALYSWPGNIRELQNTVENMILMNDAPVVRKNLIPLTIMESIGEQQVGAGEAIYDQCENLGESINRVEKNRIINALEESRGFITQAASRLGTTRRILKYKMDKMGIQKDTYKKIHNA